MSLEKYCHRRLIVLPRHATAYEAARAMHNNHIGAVLVRDRKQVVGIVTDRDLALGVVGAGLAPHQVRLHEVMTRAPATIEIDSTEEQAAALMTGFHVRRLVVLERGKLAGLVTLDDLAMANAVDKKQLKEIVFGQLSEEAPAKPEGVAHPIRPPPRPGARQQRRQSRRQQTMGAFLRQLEAHLHFGDARAALEAFEIVASALVRRLTPNEAKDFAAQLPAEIQDWLLDLPRGPDRRVNLERVEEALAQRFDLRSEDAAEVARGVGQALGELVSAGELHDVRSQLPRDLRQLLPAAA